MGIKRIHGNTARAMKREHDAIRRAEAELRVIQRLMNEMGMTQLEAIGALEIAKRKRRARKTNNKEKKQ